MRFLCCWTCVALCFSPLGWVWNVFLLEKSSLPFTVYFPGSISGVLIILSAESDEGASLPFEMSAGGLWGVFCGVVGWLGFWGVHFLVLFCHVWFVCGVRVYCFSWERELMCFVVAF